VAPELQGLLGMVELHEKRRVAEAFLEELQALALTSEPAIGAVMSLWIQRSREVLARADAVAYVVAECGEIAEGRQRPDWWVSMLSQRGVKNRS
jgi:hypothetical protein